MMVTGVRYSFVCASSSSTTCILFKFLFPGMRRTCRMSNSELMCCAILSLTSSESADFCPAFGPDFRRTIGIGTEMTAVSNGCESAISSERREVTVFFNCKTSVVLQLLFRNRSSFWGSIAKQRLQKICCFGHSAVTTWHGVVHCRKRNCQLQN